VDPRVVCASIGLLLYVLAGLLAAPLLLAARDGDVAALSGFATSAVLVAACALLLRFLGRGARRALHRKDAFGIVAFIWVFLGLFGALPFLVEGSITSFSSALFEAVSGFTTTGATVVADVDGLSRATNLWRCEMHWVGGMGIVVLFVAIFPTLGVGAKQLFWTEAPGPTREGLQPRIRTTAVTLWWIYSALTTLCGLLLWGLGLDPFDAVCHAMSALGTGGFSTRTASVGAFPSAAVQWVVALFMLIAGLNFGLYYALLHGRVREVLRNAELRFYLGVNVAVVALVALLILPRHEGVLDTLRHATFQVLAVTTTTGFMTEDFDTYPHVVRWVLLLLMFMGGCAGSTAGGIKASRILLLGKLALREVRSVVQPQAVTAVRLGRQVVPPAVLTGVLVFATTYLGLFAAATTLLMGMGLELVTASSAAVACLSSIGPGLDAVGPAQSYAFIPGPGKVLLCLCMIAGRLELFTLLAVLNPECWRR